MSLCVGGMVKHIYLVDSCVSPPKIDKEISCVATIISLLIVVIDLFRP